MQKKRHHQHKRRNFNNSHISNSECCELTAIFCLLPELKTLKEKVVLGCFCDSASRKSAYYIVLCRSRSNFSRKKLAVEESSMGSLLFASNGSSLFWAPNFILRAVNFKGFSKSLGFNLCSCYSKIFFLSPNHFNPITFVSKFPPGKFVLLPLTILKPLNLPINSPFSD